MADAIKRLAAALSTLHGARCRSAPADAIERCQNELERAAVADPAAAQAEVDRLDRAQASILAQLARGLVGQAVADEQIDRLGRARQAAQDALLAARARAAGIHEPPDADALADAIEALRRGCELAGPDLRQRTARALIARATWRPGAISADLTISAATHVAGSARRTCAVYPLGLLRVAVPDARSAA